MLETAVVEATLHRALAGGGDFADVFVEDRAVTSATYDDGKVEEMRSGPQPGRRDPGGEAARPPASRTPPTSPPRGSRPRPGPRRPRRRRVARGPGGRR